MIILPVFRNQYEFGLNDCIVHSFSYIMGSFSFSVLSSSRLVIVAITRFSKPITSAMIKSLCLNHLHMRLDNFNCVKMIPIATEITANKLRIAK